MYESLLLFTHFSQCAPIQAPAVAMACVKRMAAHVRAGQDTQDPVVMSVTAITIAMVHANV